uniref:Uncharacterized protein n=1 Tax=Arundo donax TaxID=35708 RepID=A0A0A9FZT8_ARUDO
MSGGSPRRGPRARRRQ